MKGKIQEMKIPKSQIVVFSDPNSKPIINIRKQNKYMDLFGDLGEEQRKKYFNQQKNQNTNNVETNKQSLKTENKESMPGISPFTTTPEMTQINQKEDKKA